MDNYHQSRAKNKYDEHIIVYVTCGLISKSGVTSYVADEPNTKKKKEKLLDSRRADHLFEELLFANAIDNFNCYLSDLLIEILEVDPRPIYGNKFDAKAAFLAGDIDNLRSELIDRMIIDLGYQSIGDLTDFIDNRFGLESLSHWLTKARLHRLIQIRNIVTHNRSIVNKTFLVRTGSKSDRNGERAKIRFPLITVKYLNTLVEKLDREAVIKFQLRASEQ